ncbi:MAG TPA: dephospho-CoA kinase [Salinivirgaceae bacterium]|nr:dephospho-CoA kinase [Salinivirgaceae bacterium]
MILVGLTGGIGSGKSTVAKIFQLFEIPVYDSDRNAKKIMTTNTAVRDQLISEFGTTTFLPDGSLNTQYLAYKVFNNHELLIRVNEIVHPAVRNDIQQWSISQQSPYVIVESALLFESNFYQTFHKIVSVVADLEIRINRIMLRSNLTLSEILDRIKNQVDDNVRIKNSHFIIENNLDSLLISQVSKIHSEIWANLQNG